MIEIDADPAPAAGEVSDPQKQRKKRARHVKVFYVYRDGVACGFADPISFGLGFTLASGHREVSDIIPRAGVLAPGVSPVAPFRSKFRATLAIRVLDRIRRKFAGTMVDDMPRLAPLLKASKIEIKMERVPEDKAPVFIDNYGDQPPATTLL